MKNSEDRALHLNFERPLVELEDQLNILSQLAKKKDVNVTKKISQAKHHTNLLHQKIFSNLSSFQKLQLARHPNRPRTLDYIEAITDDWLELHGDRYGFDDLAIVGGLAIIAGKKVLIIGHQKGKNTKDNIARNFGMASPAGYRKAIRLMKHANRFKIPILTFIDTPGAWAGVEAEHQGQGRAIAHNLREMFKLSVPIICTVIGEGGSGGALGIGIGDRILMLEHSVYSVASPEACAAILWKDTQKSSLAASALKMTAWELKRLGIIDKIIPESSKGAHLASFETSQILKRELLTHLSELNQLNELELRKIRYQKFRKMGVFMS